MGKVFVVDDDAGIRNLLVNLLEANGYEVSAFAAGTEAISAAEQNRPDVVLIDLLLDDMPGLAVMKRIKKIDSSVECIVVTGNPTKDSAIAAVNLGAFGFVTKPWGDAELLVMTKSGIRQVQTSRSLLEKEIQLKNLLAEKD